MNRDLRGDPAIIESLLYAAIFFRLKFLVLLIPKKLYALRPYKVERTGYHPSRPRATGGREISA